MNDEIPPLTYEQAHDITCSEAYKPADEYFDIGEFWDLILNRMKLTENEVSALRLIYLENRTYAEAGKIIGLSHERVRQIEKKALRKLRHRSRRNEIYTFCDWLKHPADEPDIEPSDEKLIANPYFDAERFYYSFRQRRETRNDEELKIAENRLSDLGFFIIRDGDTKVYIDEHDDFVIYADPRRTGKIQFRVFLKPLRKGNPVPYFNGMFPDPFNIYDKISEGKIHTKYKTEVKKHVDRLRRCQNKR